MNKLIFAPDSFKGTLSARAVCEIWARAAKRHLPGCTLISLPISDGGEGLVSVLHNALGGEIVELEVRGPLGEPVKAEYLCLPNKTIVVEMASASGLPLVSKDARNPLNTSTYGVGELLVHALERGARHVILGLGGSATNDGGAGAAMALGLRLLKADGTPIMPTGGGLGELVTVDASAYQARLAAVKWTIACDVDNPLRGERGASAIYGPQKGATPEQVAVLDANLAHFARILEQDSGRAVADSVGCGAAGGFALPLLTYGDAQLRGGIDVVLEAVGFDTHLIGCDLVLTGEGMSDAQSAMGKAIAGIARRAQSCRVPVVVLSGALGSGAQELFHCGVTALLSACQQPMSLEFALEHAQENLEQAADNLFRLLAIKGISYATHPNCGADRF